MPDGLKTEIMSIVKSLEEAKKDRLAECIKNNWFKTALEYSKELNSWQADRPMEKELAEAFDSELGRLGVANNLKSKILNSLRERRVLQTGPHLVATEGPRMLCINWLGSLGVHREDFYVVGMSSGIPFSNSFRPGRINKAVDSLNLFPSNMQDALVYRSIIPDKLSISINELGEEMNPLKKLLPKASSGDSYTAWALQVCQNIERKILGKENLIYLDINEVVSNYLMRVLKNKGHVLYKIFFDEMASNEFTKTFPEEVMFYSPVLDGKYEKMENIIFDGSALKRQNKKIILNDPKNLIDELENSRLCPGLNILFLTLAFLNGFKCLGSFYQVEYLPDYLRKFSNLNFMRDSNVDSIPTANLTTGVFPEYPELYPVDIILNDKFKANPNILFGELLLPIKDKLINGRNKQHDKK